MTEPLIVRSAKGEKVDRTPAWMMRQAGRYLPEYRAIREKADFLTMVRTPELAAEVTLQPLRRFKIDAAIIFSDILVIPEAMGMKVEFLESKGPVFHQPVRTPEDVRKLVSDPDIIVENLSYVFEALTLTRRELSPEKGLIGFAGAPWTLAAYMIEGKGSKNFQQTRRFAFRYPEAFQELLEKLGRAIAIYLKHQVEAGAQLVQIFDSWAGFLNPQDFHRYCFLPVRKIIADFRKIADAPVIYFPKGANGSLTILPESGANIISVDWTVNLADVRRWTDDRIILQGNMDPLYLFSDPQTIRREVARILEEMKGAPGHIFNLGHGVLPETPVENVEAFFQAIYELSPAYH